MKLIQAIHNTAGKRYFYYECEVCGYTLTTDDETLNPVCPNCSEWAEDVAEEMEESNDKS